jgi:DNA-binding transcriptional ArsR family regulator
MVGEPDVAFVASLLSEPSRAAMCLALMDGRIAPAGELARRAGISAQTASDHLAKLIGGGIVEVEHRGRWRYYRLATEEVARAVEALACVAPPVRKTRPGTEERAQQELYAARTCYRHLAGQLGVALADALLRQEWIVVAGDHYAITPGGAVRLRALGIDLPALRRGHHVAARKCLDWRERRPHVAGPLGMAIAELAFTSDWIRRQKGTRSVLLTPFGRAELKQLFGVHL